MLFEEDLKYVPGKYHELVRMAYDDVPDRRDLLRQLEETIKECYPVYRKNDVSHIDSNYRVRSYKINERRCLLVLLAARRNLMDRLFVMTEDAYRQLETINGTLTGLSREAVRKTRALYEAWLENEEPAWRYDSQVYGRVIAEGYEEKPADGTVSDYATMSEIIEDVAERELFRIEFSGSPDRIPDKSFVWDYPVISDEEFCYRVESPFGSFPMCHAFETLYRDTMYSSQDILRIAMYWADVAVIHQRIVNPQGVLVK